MAREKKWIIAQKGDAETVSRLSSELGVDPVLAELLVQRGVNTFSQARSFFRPDINSLYDPFLMKDMLRAVERVHQAIETGEKILIYGDYDADGTTAVSLVYLFLHKLTNNIGFYIPDRGDEGYGLSYKGLDYAHKNGYTLIFTLDCGIKAMEKVDYAKTLGIDVIIGDHHLPEPGQLPSAVAVLDPKREDCDYPFDDLSGCGVGFKFVQAYSLKFDLPFADILPLLDLLVVSIATDLVSVVDENRILAHYGLKILNENPRKGLLALIHLSGLEPGHLTIDDIVFKIGPRLNAAGRMESGSVAVELLTAQDDEEAVRIGTEINDYNNERKNIDRRITQEALEMVTNKTCLLSGSATIVYNPQWHKGVVGIVASRLVEAFYKPTFVLTKSNGFVTGSARSIHGFDLYEAIESCADILENFGGHLYAAGLTMKEEHLPEFCSRMEEFISARIKDAEIFTPLVNVDSKLDFAQITPKFFRILKQFQPFGPGNTAPVFLTEHVYDNGNGRRVGADGGHLKLELIQESQPYHHMSAIAFNMSSYFDNIKAGNPVDVCYSIVENYYRGSVNPQLRVKDLHERDEVI